MASAAYQHRRGQLESYFDRTAAEAWSRLTSDAPLGRIRATVRAGRDRMRASLLGWLPMDLGGARVLDAGCGTGALAVEAARRGADVLAVDLAGTLLTLARTRVPAGLPGRIEFRAGDMLDPTFGRFDYVVAMDSLIHYQAADMVAALAALTSRTEQAVLFTFAPRTPALAVMHAAGRLFPRGNRAPAIEPVAEAALRGRLTTLDGWHVGRNACISGGFYTSHAFELVRP